VPIVVEGEVILEPLRLNSARAVGAVPLPAAAWADGTLKVLVLLVALGLSVSSRSVYILL
jgi:hypothetical protein